jgi:hypothetical protein
MGCFSASWFALMRRNMIYLRRNWISTVSVANKNANGFAMFTHRRS